MKGHTTGRARPRIRRAIGCTILSILLIALTSAGSAAFGKGADERGEIIDRTLTAVAQSYYDPGRVNPREMLDGALEEMQLSIPEILVKQGSGGRLDTTVGLASKKIKARPMGSLVDLSRTLRNVLEFSLMHYRSQADIPPDEVEYSAVGGMLNALDPHSSFLPPKVYRDFRIGTKGKFGGLGIVISIKDGLLTVITPIEGTPAWKAGILAGDRILQIEDESTINMSLTDAVNKLRGDVGSKVTIAVESPGKPSRKITVTRALINIDSVKHALLMEDGKRIGYIKIKNFQSNTDDDVKQALAEFHKDGAKLDGLILDMRNNPGGLLHIAVDVANRFMREGVIVSTVGPRNRVMDVDKASSAGTEPDYPMVVLVNEGSASAAEIVAGALALNDRAVLVGHRTFGKGSVQTIFEVGDGAAVKLTIAQYKPGGKESIQLRGITPDIALLPNTIDADEMNIAEDKRISEKDLEKPLGEESTAEGPLAESEFRIGYLAPRRDKKWLEEKSRREYSKKPDIADDFAVEFARQLIVQAGDPSAKKMLEQGSEAVKQAQAAQDKKIVEALTALGIDWTRAKANGKPAIAVSHRMTKGGKATSTARAGDKINLEVVVTNTGKGPYSRLIAVGESESPFLEGVEFPFGRLGPGQTRSFSVPIEVPEDEPSANRVVTLNFDESNGNAPNPIEITVPVKAGPHPEFSFKFNMPTVREGRPIPKGVSIPVSVDIINSGKGRSGDETVATISNECGEGFFIERGRSKIGALAPGARRRVNFGFHISKGGELEDDCAIKLAVADLKYLTVMSKRIELMPDTGVTKPAERKVYGPPTIELAQAPQSTSDDFVLISGTIKDVDPIRDCFIFVKDRKVAYIPNAESSNTMAFSVNVPVEEGYNRISIGARDTQDIMARKVIVVVRRKAKKAS